MSHTRKNNTVGTLNNVHLEGKVYKECKYIGSDTGFSQYRCENGDVLQQQFKCFPRREKIGDLQEGLSRAYCQTRLGFFKRLAGIVSGRIEPEFLVWPAEKKILKRHNE